MRFTAAMWGSALFACAPGDAPSEQPPDPTIITSSTSGATSSTTQVANQPPSLALSIVPEAPTAADTLEAVVEVQDPDGDAVALQVVWRSSASAGPLGKGVTLAGGFARGDTVEVEVEATDGEATVSARADVIIENTPPVGERAVVSPASPRTDDDLTCSGEGYVDLDGDEEGWRFSWSVDGEEFEGAVLDASWTHRDSDMSCTAIPWDGVGEGSPLVVEVQLENTAPEVTVSIDPVEVSMDTPEVSARVDASDRDGDPLETAWVWRLEGEEVSVGEVWSGAWSPGELIEVEVTVTDGFDAVTETARTTVINRPPEVRSMSFLPREPLRTGDEDVRVSLDAFDPDGAVLMWVTHWWVDDVYIGRDDVLPMAITRDQQIRAEVEVTDGDEVTIAVHEGVVANAPPVAPEVILIPEPRAGDAFDCRVAGEMTDLEGDSLDVTLELFRDGELYESTQVEWGVSGAGETWSCRVTVDDGIDEASHTETFELEARSHNVLLLLADDFGTDKVTVYGEHPEAPPTPHIDQLAADGVLFRNAWANPICSPTRATLLTGRHARRHGVGGVVEPEDNTYMLPYEEELIPELLSESHVPYDSMWIGKWHLASFESEDSFDHPVLSGFARFTGALGNLEVKPEGIGSYDYNQWWKTESGSSFEHDVYATTDNVDDALDAIATMAEPWFIGLSFNAPHLPLTPPPEELHTAGSLSELSDEVVLYHAMVEAMDTEIGRLLEWMDPDVAARTTVIFMGDNGTPRHAILEPRSYLEDKGTLHEGGVNVPLIVSGPDVAVPGSESAALVHASDLFSTAMHTAGVPSTDFANPVDGQTLIPYLMDPDLPGMREKVFSDWFVPIDAGSAPETEMLAVRGERYKLIVIQSDPYGVYYDQFYDLEDSHVDGDNLLDLGPLTVEQQVVYEQMQEDIMAHRELE